MFLIHSFRYFLQAFEEISHENIFDCAIGPKTQVTPSIESLKHYSPYKESCLGWSSILSDDCS